MALSDADVQKQVVEVFGIVIRMCLENVDENGADVLLMVSWCWLQLA